MRNGQFDLQGAREEERRHLSRELHDEFGGTLTGLKMDVARLQRALIAYMLDLHIRQGYTEKYLPFMVKTETVFGAGQLPKFADNLY